MLTLFTLNQIISSTLRCQIESNQPNSFLKESFQQFGFVPIPIDTTPHPFQLHPAGILICARFSEVAAREEEEKKRSQHFHRNRITRGKGFSSPPFSLIKFIEAGRNLLATAEALLTKRCQMNIWWKHTEQDERPKQKGGRCCCCWQTQEGVALWWNFGTWRVRHCKKSDSFSKILFWKNKFLAEFYDNFVEKHLYSNKCGL